MGPFFKSDGEKLTFLISASFLGMDVASVHPGHILWSFCHQDHKPQGHPAVPHRNSGNEEKKIIQKLSDVIFQLFSLLPILVGMGLHFYDCYEFLTEGLSDNVVVWQGYPYSVLWYAFFFVALQVIFVCKVGRVGAGRVGIEQGPRLT